MKESIPGFGQYEVNLYLNLKPVCNFARTVFDKARRICTEKALLAEAAEYFDF
jgi:hypothetical protein